MISLKRRLRLKLEYHKRISKRFYFCIVAYNGDVSVVVGKIAFAVRKNNWFEVGRMNISTPMRGHGMMSFAFDEIVKEIKRRFIGAKIRVSTNSPVVNYMMFKRGYRYRLGETLSTHKCVGVWEWKAITNH